MGHALPVQTDFKAPLPHKTAVMGNGSKMFPGFHTAAPPLGIRNIIFRSLRKCNTENT
jgi:hypothetical protein